jgi:hypothetical protein
MLDINERLNNLEARLLDIEIRLGMIAPANTGPPRGAAARSTAPIATAGPAHTATASLIHTASTGRPAQTASAGAAPRTPARAAPPAPRARPSGRRRHADHRRGRLDPVRAAPAAHRGGWLRDSRIPAAAGALSGLPDRRCGAGVLARAAPRGGRNGDPAHRLAALQTRPRVIRPSRRRSSSRLKTPEAPAHRAASAPRRQRAEPGAHPAFGRIASRPRRMGSRALIASSTESEMCVG